MLGPATAPIKRTSGSPAEPPGVLSSMIFTDGSGWPEIEVRREAGWDLLAEQAVPLMQQILADHSDIVAFHAYKFELPM